MTAEVAQARLKSGCAGPAMQARQNQGSATREAGLGRGREEEMNLFGPPPLFKYSFKGKPKGHQG